MNSAHRVILIGRRSVGFLLMELLLALVVSAIVATLVATMLASAATATSEQMDLRQSIVQGHLAAERLGSALRCSSMVLSCTGDQLVLWKGDANDNGKPDLSELRRLSWDPDTQSVVMCESPTNLSNAEDASFELDADFASVAASHAGSSAFPQRTLLRHVAHWACSVDSVPIQQASFIRVMLQFQFAGRSEDVSVIAALRAKERVS